MDYHWQGTPALVASALETIPPGSLVLGPVTRPWWFGEDRSFVTIRAPAEAAPLELPEGLHQGLDWLHASVVGVFA